LKNDLVTKRKLTEAATLLNAATLTYKAPFFLSTIQLLKDRIQPQEICRTFFVTKNDLYEKEFY